MPVSVVCTVVFKTFFALTPHAEQVSRCSSRPQRRRSPACERLRRSAGWRLPALLRCLYAASERGDAPRMGSGGQIRGQLVPMERRPRPSLCRIRRTRATRANRGHSTPHWRMDDLSRAHRERVRFSRSASSTSTKRGPQSRRSQTLCACW
jgi:hypothetical protein